MLKNRRFTMVFLLTVMLMMVMGCGQNKQKKMRDEMIALKKELYNTNSTLSSYDVAEKAISTFRTYATQYPEDSISLEYHIEAGYIAWALSQYPLSLEIYKEIIDLHPGNDRMPFLYLRIGSIANDDLKDTITAKKYYEMLMADYPTSEFAKGAETGLKTLGMDVDEQLRYILQQQASNADSLELEAPEI